MPAVEVESLPKRRGIFGGTFDPIHLAHIKLASLAAEQCGLDEVTLVPCHIAPHRDRAVATSEQRLEMLQLTLADFENFEVSDFELAKFSTSYTLETLQHFCQQQPNTEWVFCLGGDSLRDFTTWHRWQEILELAHLVVLDRGAALRALPAELSTQFVGSAEELTEQAGQVLLLDAPEIPVSASELRHRLGQIRASDDQSLDALLRDPWLSQWLHPNVLKYIIEHQVYQ